MPSQGIGLPDEDATNNLLRALLDFQPASTSMIAMDSAAKERLGEESKSASATAATSAAKRLGSIVEPRLKNLTCALLPASQTRSPQTLTAMRASY